jgi:positive phototaxis protein PixI
MTQTTLERLNRQETYLHLQLTRDIHAVIPMHADGSGEGGDKSHQLQEVLTLSIDRLTPIPNRPRWVMGLLNQRSRIFWVLDLADFLGFPPLTTDDQTPSCAIIQVDRRVIGLGVQQVCGIVRMNPDRVRSAVGTVSPTLEPYLRGCVSRSNESLLVLDPSALVHGANERWVNH